MDSLTRYLELMKKHPEFFRYSDEPGGIKIINNDKRILAEQKKIRARLKREDHPPFWIGIGVLVED